MNGGAEAAFKGAERVVLSDRGRKLSADGRKDTPARSRTGCEIRAVRGNSCGNSLRHNGLMKRTGDIRCRVRVDGV